MVRLDGSDPVAVALTASIREGDLAALAGLLDGHDGLASARIEDSSGCARTPLHLATDWPGYFPHAPDTVRLLLGAGADPDAPMTGGRHAETPLHWAASTDDVEAAEALVEGGADVEAPGAVIDGGPPLADAVAFGCWHVARLLVARGARVDTLWQAAALGMAARVEELLAGDPGPSREELNHGFWQACHGGQRRVAEALFGRGADVNWHPDHNRSGPLEIARAPDTRRDGLAAWLLDHGARPAGPPPEIASSA
jgi:hypothetical protein